MLEEYIIPWTINIGMALAIFIIGRIAIGIIISIAGKMLSKANVDPMLCKFVLSIAKTVLLLFVIVAALEQIGVDTTSFIALIGAAGLAVGLALQSSLQNFASGVMLIVFRPFKIGDFIEAGGSTGTVEQIGIFTTTLKTGDNREIIIPNGAIYGGKITNNSARDTRRIDMVFGIGYDADLKKAKQLIQDILAADERIHEDPAPLVAVAELADSSVNFNVRPWVNSGDYWAVYYDLNEKIKLAFDDAGISIPFPQMDIHLNKND